MTLDFTRCRDVWVPPDPVTGKDGFWSPPPPHVKIGVEWIIKHPYMLLADDMGGMKSAQAIIGAQFLHDMDVIDRVIVVAPASVRPKVWYDEDLGQLHEQVFEDKNTLVSEYHQKVRSWRHGPQKTLKCSKCSTPARDETQEHPGICICGGYLDDVITKELRWIVTNYEFIRSHANLLVLLPYCTPKTLLVLDESSAVRTWDAAQTQACMLLRWRQNKGGKPVLGAARCGRILLLNGTPIAESPLDMFAQGNLMHPDILQCKYITHYKGRYAIQTPVMTWEGKPKLNQWNKPILTIAPGAESWVNLGDLQRRFAPYVLRREAKELGIDFALPPIALTVPLTKTTWKAYCDMCDEMVVWLKSDVAAASTAAVKSLRLAQITSGFVGGVEPSRVEDDVDEGLLESLVFDGMPPPISKGEVDRQIHAIDHPKLTIQEIGREKLDFTLEWHADLLRRYPDLKLLTWCRFVPELRRYLKEVVALFPNMSVGAACGEKVLDMVPGSQKAEREYALRLLHPKTAPTGPATVGATQGTGAMGLNFTACRTVLDMSYDFSPWKKKQGDARVNRPGQTGPVSFFYLVAVGPRGQKTIDHHILMHRLGKTNVNDWTTAAWVRALQEE